MNREDFEILGEKVYNRPLIYLDNAATTQKPRVVLDAIQQAYTHWNSNVHRGVHHLSQVATQHHEEAREKAAQFLGSRSPREIIFTKGTTDSLNMLARSLGDMYDENKQKWLNAGDEIWVSEVEHHSNIVPWQMLCERNGCVLRVFHRGEMPVIGPKTRLISVAYVSNVLGIIQPVEEIIRLAHEKGVPVCVDAAQAAPHLPIRVQELDCDWLVLSGHKMYGPTGIGILYGKEQWLEKMPPVEGGGEMIEHVRWDKTTYNTLPYKFEAGTPNYIGSYALGAAIDYLTKIGMEKVAEHENELCSYAESVLQTIPGIQIYAQGERKAGAVSFNLYSADGRLIHPFDVGTLLDRQGIAVRTGHHCAEPLIDSLGVPGTVRISFGIYNTKEDIDAFKVALDRAVSMLC